MRRTIVLFGDSITQTGFSTGANFAGWAGLLANSYARRADVLNRGFSGYNTRHALDALPSVFGSVEGRSSVGRPLFVTVLLGANDSSLPGDREHCQHVPVDEYEDNLKKIVDAIECAFEGGTTKPPIIMITPPPVDAPSWDQYCMDAFGELASRTNEVAGLYGERVKSVARASSCSGRTANETARSAAPLVSPKSASNSPRLATRRTSKRATHELRKQRRGADRGRRSERISIPS
ncbi:hypothetical protein ACHAWF_012235 [Thalassiosira exigua]